MLKKYKIIIPILFTLGVLGGAIAFLIAGDAAVLNSKGPVAEQERNLLIFTFLLSLVIIVPVFVLTFFIIWKYRESNKKAKYAPDWDGNRKLEFTWWAIPCLIILVLAGVTWKSSHDLDPYKPLEADRQALNVQVIALPWKWLFLYPDRNIATVNYVRLPEDTPINFTITADAPMNSFWIPQLGGQVYAMPGMSTKLHLMADEPGKYQGSSANLSGEGFAGMRFVAEVQSQAAFEEWAESVSEQANPFTLDKYDAFAKPSKNVPRATYSSYDSSLYDKVVMKYMAPRAQEGDASAGESEHAEHSSHH